MSFLGQFLIRVEPYKVKCELKFVQRWIPNPHKQMKVLQNHKQKESMIKSNPPQG